MGRGNGKINKGIGMHYVSVHQVHGKTSRSSRTTRPDSSSSTWTDKRNPKFLSQFDYLTPEFQKDRIRAWAPHPHPRLRVCQTANGNPARGAACGNAHSAKLVPARTSSGSPMSTSTSYGTCVSRRLEHEKTEAPLALPVRQECQPDLRVMRAEPIGASRQYLWQELLFLGWYGLGVKAINISNPKAPTGGTYSIASTTEWEAREHTMLFSIRRETWWQPTKVTGVRVLQYTGRVSASIICGVPAERDR